MAKVVRFHQLGGPENLKIEDLPLRELRKGEVKLRVQAVGLNRAESMFYHGMYLEEPQLPSGLGYEAAGVIAEVGPGVDRDWVGKTASTIPAFSMIEYGMVGEEVIAPVAALGEYPPNLTPVEGAAIWMQYVTAYGALIEFGHVTAGDFVLIPAASSSVGLAAIQIVKDAGAVSIAATRTSKKRDQLLALGADHVIATEEENSRLRRLSLVPPRAASATPACTRESRRGLRWQAPPWPTADACRSYVARAQESPETQGWRSAQTPSDLVHPGTHPTFPETDSSQPPHLFPNRSQCSIQMHFDGPLS